MRAHRSNLFFAILTAFTLLAKLFRTASGTFSSEAHHALEAVAIDLDLHRLLGHMIQHAARVVSAVVEIASNACNDDGKHPISRSASFLAMPPPGLPARTGRKRALPFQRRSLIGPEGDGRAGLDLLCRAADVLPVVSPDLTGAAKPDWTVRSLDLEAGVDDSEEVSNLTVDQCADIVDTCLFGGEFTDSPEPPPKRTKIEG